MIVYQNVNIVIIQSDIGLIVMTKNYLPVNVGESNEIVSNVLNENEYFIDNTLRNGLSDIKYKVVIKPFDTDIVENSEEEEIITSTVYSVLIENLNWLNSSNLTESEKNKFKSKLIKTKEGTKNEQII